MLARVLSPVVAAAPLAYCLRLLNSSLVTSGDLGMRLALISLLLLIAGCVPARCYESANELLSDCERFLRAVGLAGHSFSIQNDDPQSWACWGYIRAFQGLSATVFEGEKLSITHACPPEEGTMDQMVRVFVVFARKHPESLHKRAAAVALDAFRS